MNTNLDPILRLPAVMQAVGLKSTEIWNRIKAGTFPKPKALGPRARGWRQSEIQEWIDSRPTATAA